MCHGCCLPLWEGLVGGPCHNSLPACSLPATYLISLAALPATLQHGCLLPCLPPPWHFCKGHWPWAGAGQARQAGGFSSIGYRHLLPAGQLQHHMTTIYATLSPSILYMALFLLFPPAYHYSLLLTSSSSCPRLTPAWHTVSLPPPATTAPPLPARHHAFCLARVAWRDLQDGLLLPPSPLT